MLNNLLCVHCLFLCAIPLLCCLRLTLHRTMMPLPVLSGSTTATYLFIYPSLSSLFCLSKTGDGERFTLAASSLVVSLASFCSSRRIRISVLSNVSVIPPYVFMFAPAAITYRCRYFACRHCRQDAISAAYITHLLTYFGILFF